MSDGDRASIASPTNGAGSATWWGEFSLDEGSWGRWRIGPLDLWIGRTEHQWRVAWTRDDDPARDEVGVEVPADVEREPLPKRAEQHRFAYARTSETVELKPMLADRPVVARPETRISVPAGERVSVFVSSAIWVRIGVASRKEPLIELPCWRSTDTWFGDNRTGFLCYATRTAMRLDDDEMPVRPHRAVTPIVIDNQGDDVLGIERLSLPAPNLSVFGSPSGSLWTERLHLTRREDAELALVHIVRDRPPVPGAVRLGEPRTVAGDRLLRRVFTGLFG